MSYRHVTIRINGIDDGEFRKDCSICGSVRDRYIALSVKHLGALESWPHLTIKQAMRLKEWLENAIDEAKRREAEEEAKRIAIKQALRAAQRSADVTTP